MSPKLKSAELLPTPRSLKALCLQLNHGDMDIEERTRVKPIIGESRPHTLANLMVLILFWYVSLHLYFLMENFRSKLRVAARLLLG